MKQKIGKIKGVPFRYIPKKEISINDINIIGYFRNKERTDNSKPYLVIKSIVDNNTKLYLELKPKKDFGYKTKGYVYLNDNNYAVYTKLFWWPILFVPLLFVPLLILLLFTLFPNKLPDDIKKLPLQQMSDKKEKENKVDDNFDIPIVSAGTITKDNKCIPFTNPATNKLLCKYIFYDENHNKLEETDYIAPTEDQYYYFDAYRYFSNGKHTLYFTVQTFHADTGKPDTSANLSMPITVIKE